MDNLPGGCKSMEEFSAYIHRRIEECMKQDKTKEETMQHLMHHYQIKPDMTSLVWDLLEAKYPEHFRAHYESCESYRMIREASTIDAYKRIPRFYRSKREIKQESSLLPKDFKSAKEFSYYVHGRIMECMRYYRSKEETVKHLLEKYEITPESTNAVWDRLEQDYAHNFRSYYEACEKYHRKLREQEASKVTATAQITAETRSCSRSLVSKTSTLKSLKDIKVINLEKLRTFPPGQKLMETGPSSQVPRLGPDAQANEMNLEQLLLLLKRSRDEVKMKKHA